MKRLVYLTGAGMSIKAGMPSSAALTTDLLTSQRIVRFSDALYYLDGPVGDPERSRFEVYRNQVLLRALSGVFMKSTSYEVGRVISYEDLYFLLSQLSHHLSGSVHNPFVGEAIVELTALLRPLLKEKRRDTETALMHLISEAMKMTESLVFLRLLAAPGPLDYLDALLSPLDHRQGTEVTIFTLNHDLVLEKYLAGKRLHVYDGFSSETPAQGRFETISPVWLWDPWKDPAPTQNDVRFFKIHGSVDWFFNGEDWYRPAVEPDPLDRQTQRMQAASIALGTHNKYNFYSWSIFSDVQTLFRRSLKDSQHLIIAGFSFNDRLVSNMIEAWMAHDPKRRLLLVDPNAEAILQSRRHPLKDEWSAWRASKRVTISAAYVEELDAQVVQAFLAD